MCCTKWYRRHTRECLQHEANSLLTEMRGTLHCCDCFEHAGVSNDFLISTRNETALIYNDVSVNENMHLATAFKILRRPGNNLMEHLSAEQYRFFRRTVIQIVLATDMAGHAELLQASAWPLHLSNLFPCSRQHPLKQT